MMMDNHKFREIHLLRRQICDMDVKRLSRQDIQEALCSHKTLGFNEISMGLNFHEPWGTATNQDICRWIGGYRFLTRYTPQVMILYWGAVLGYRT